MKSQTSSTLVAAISMCVLAAVLSGCISGGNGGKIGGINLSTLSPATSFESKAEKEIISIKTSGGLVASDLSTGMMSVGDTASEPKRAIITFNTSGLFSEVADAHVSLFFDSQGASDEIGNLGALQLCRISAVANPAASDYSAAEHGCVNVFTAQSQYSAMAQGTEVVVNVTDLLQDSLQDGESLFSVKLRFTNESNGGNNGFNFYGHYTSVVLDSKIARLSGATRP